jgi:hypothetical protein
MRLARRLTVAISVVITGAGAALLFRKDPRQADTPTRLLENPFRQRVERRVPVGAAWVRKIGAPYGSQSVTPIATASIPRTSAGDGGPTFQKNLNPVGSLLEPIDGIAPADEEPPALATEPSTFGSDAPARTHVVVDGDTLTRLAVQYLGRADGYAEIFALNRGILASPDLLPIGATLKIPPRKAPAPPDGSGPKVRLEEPRALGPG